MVLARQWVEKLSRERAEREQTAMNTAPLQPPPAMPGPPLMYQRDMGPPAMMAPQPPQYGCRRSLAPRNIASPGPRRNRGRGQFHNIKRPSTKRPSIKLRSTNRRPIRRRRTVCH